MRNNDFDALIKNDLSNSYSISSKDANFDKISTDPSNPHLRPDSKLSNIRNTTVSPIPYNIDNSHTHKKKSTADPREEGSLIHHPSIDMIQISKNSIDINDSIID